MKNMPIIYHKTIRSSERKIKDINWHENIEILHFIDGEGYVSCDENSIKVAKDDVVIVNSNVLHSFSTESLMEYHCIIIDRDFAFKNGIDTSKFQFSESISCDKTLIEYFENIYNIMSKNYEYIDIAAAVLPALCYLYHNYSTEISHEKKIYNIIKYAITYILENIK